MKNTLNFDVGVMRRLKRKAAHQVKTMSDLVKAALRVSLHGNAARAGLPPLPLMKSGGALVDIADRDELDGAMKRR